MKFNPPYYAVIFTSTLKQEDESFSKTDELLEKKLPGIQGYLGHENYRNPDQSGVTISYWKDLEAIQNWKADADHAQAQEMGKKKWYSKYRLRIAKVEKEYGFSLEEGN